MDSNMKKEIVIHPLQIYKGELPTVIYSGRGSQYRSLGYQELLTDHHITHSMSQPGTHINDAGNRMINQTRINRTQQA
ncbi:hypothetical protein [Enterococcus sp. AZ135]|uniref:hypothetical protein n=1 Tax=Enterococcus sp. AZ135 TaxID=2774631 RepID=UPI003F686478